MVDIIYTNTKLLWPKTYIDSEYVIPKTADLRGVSFDPASQCIITYDQTENKILWVQLNSGNVEQGAPCAFPDTPMYSARTGVGVVDLVVVNDVLHLLTDLGNGVMGIYVGSLQEGRMTSNIPLNEYLLPAYRMLGTSTVWDATHDGSMRYLKYHPRYCSLLNKGDTLYLIAGMSDNVTGTAPAEMGQWLIAYDLAGFMYKYYDMDDTPTRIAPRPSVLENKLNGLAVMGCYHDGIVSIVAEGQHANDPQTGAAKFLKLLEDRNSGSGTLVPETQPFFTGPFRTGDSMYAAGNYVFFLVHNRLYQGDIYMLEVFCHFDGDLFANAIDLGVVASGMLVRRRVYVVNRSPYHTYSNLNVESNDAKVSLALVDQDTGEPISNFSERIKIPGAIPVGAMTSFCVQLTAPTILEANVVKYFHDRLSFKFEASW